jgi:hypothetical protein
MVSHGTGITGMATRMLAALTLLAATCVLQAASPSPLVVHEWGTFTSVQGQDGDQVWWLPHVKTDLPEFVYDVSVENGGFKGEPIMQGKTSLAGIVRMETPVIYFYSDVERVVDVRVRMPDGFITEWYPQATRVGPTLITNVKRNPDAALSRIEWKGVTILPRDTTEISASKLIRGRADPATDHYYAARATDANLLRVASPHARKGVEHERDLFYRGIGNFPGPLTATIDANETELSLTTASREPLAGLFVVTIKQGLMRYQRVDGVSTGERTAVALDAAPFADINQVRPQLMKDVTQALVDTGLYPKEAQAMVDTWKDQWFAEQGSRVLYLLPRAWTDQRLPLDISPGPDQLVRVMVGRAELIMPTMERALKKQIMAFNSGDLRAKEEAVAATRKLGLGRFLQPAAMVTVGKRPGQPPALVEDALKLAAAASAPEGAGSATALNH